MSQAPSGSKDLTATILGAATGGKTHKPESSVAHGSIDR